jgi:ribosomal protein S18 acetylase RimI-like enzyme
MREGFEAMSHRDAPAAADTGPADAIRLQPARAEDMALLCVLATTVFVDTYCGAGLRADQAREALVNYSVTEFERRFAQGHRFDLAWQGEVLLGFAETLISADVPQPRLAGAMELARLYVSPSAQGRGVGPRLLRHGEGLARQLRCPALWLGAWVGNTRALAFYATQGYADIGRTDYVFEEQVFENRIFVKWLASRNERPRPAASI